MGKTVKKTVAMPLMKVSKAERSLVEDVRSGLKMWSERLRWMKKKKMILDYKEPKIYYDENEQIPFVGYNYMPMHPVKSIKIGGYSNA